MVRSDFVISDSFQSNLVRSNMVRCDIVRSDLVRTGLGDHIVCVGFFMFCFFYETIYGTNAVRVSIGHVMMLNC